MFQDVLIKSNVDIDTAIFVFSERFIEFEKSTYQTATGKKILSLDNAGFIGILKFLGSDVPLFHPCLYVQDKNHTWRSTAYTFDLEKLNGRHIPENLYLQFLVNRHKDWPPSIAINI
jgi:hypothetical protein